MRTIRDPSDYTASDYKITLSIGNYDGIHLGHQSVLRQIRARGGESIVLTFENHPSTVLRKENPVEPILTLPHKVKLLEEQKVDTLLLLPFTEELSNHTAEDFITFLHEKIPFHSLVLGHDAALGKNRQGDKKKMSEIAQKFGFDITYVEAFGLEGAIVSSSKIRALIRQGDLAEASRFLGRPYSTYGKVISGSKKGSAIGYPTANLDAEGLCLPPFGVYAVSILFQGRQLQGVANLGIAPTVRKTKAPLLEVFLFDCKENLYGSMIEVIPRLYLRPERQFQNLTELSEQIEQDVKRAEDYFSETTFM